MSTVEVPEEFGWCVDEDGDLLAPWLVFPELPSTSAGWRMGGGETYLWLFLSQFRTVSDGAVEDDPVVKARLRAKYPAPLHWPHFWMESRSLFVLTGLGTAPLAFAAFFVTLPFRKAAGRRRRRLAQPGKET